MATTYVIENANSVNGNLNVEAKDTVIIKEGGFVRSTDVIAISGTSSTNINDVQIVVEGTLSSESDGALLLHGTGNTLRIGRNGLIHSGGFGATIDGTAFVFNEGRITSSGLYAINAKQSLNLINSGYIIDLNYKTGIDYEEAISGGIANDFIHNVGYIEGIVNLSSGDDIYDGRNGQVNGLIDLSLGNDRAYGGSRSETFKPGEGDDFIDGGAGIDTIVVGTADQDAVKINLSLTGPQDTGIWGRDTYLNIENVTTGRGNDSITGSGVSNLLISSGGSDTLLGQGGNDTLDGGADNDILNGGSGFDTVVFGSFASGPVFANMSNPNDARNNTGADTYISIEALIGTSFGDTFIGNASANTFKGNDGNDLLSGGSGNDTLYGGLGNDVLTGGSGKDVFIFNTTPNSRANKDQLDFSVRDDTIRVENAVFKALKKTGTLNKSYFVLSSKAKDSNDYFGYNKTTGDLWYDPNGNKTGGQVVIANLGKNKLLTNLDLVVI
jgi:Ca2+-binding RTX toxin-like protein